MPADCNEIGSNLFHSFSSKVTDHRTHHKTVVDDHFSNLYITTNITLDKHIEFEMSEHKPSMLSQMKNNVMLLQNSCSKKEMIKQNESFNGDCNKIFNLPEPKVVLFPAERVQLGWQDKKMPVGSGLDNSGLICYINSTLQALFHIPAFTNWLMNDEQHQKTCQQKNEFQKDCIVCMVHDTFLLSQKQTGSSFEASTITSHLSLICKHLSTDQQEDAHEFLRYLIESMERCYLSNLGHAAKSLDNYSKETTPINQIFGGYIRTEVTCRECGDISTTFQHFQDLIIDIIHCKNVNDALHNYFKKELLKESYECERCQRKVKADKKFSIEKAPYVLCIQLKRYSIKKGKPLRTKNNVAIQINEQLNLSKYQFEYHKYKTNTRLLKYRLVSMVMHEGTSVDSGHYTALGLTPSGSFYHFNDSKVYPTNLKNQPTNSDSYIIFYELEPLVNSNNTIFDCKTSIKSSTSSCKLPVNKCFVNKSNDVTKQLNSIAKPPRDMNVVKNINDNKDKKEQLYNKWNSNIDNQLKHEKKEKPYKASLNSIYEPVISSSNDKSMIKLVPYSDSDNDDSDTESSTLSEENKTKHSTNQKISGEISSTTILDHSSESSNKSRTRFDHCNHNNGNKSPSDNKTNGNSSLEEKIWGNVKTWDGEESFVDREVEYNKNNEVKRSFDDEYNEGCDRGVVKKKKFDNKN